MLSPGAKNKRPVSLIPEATFIPLLCELQIVTILAIFSCSLHCQYENVLVFQSPAALDSPRTKICDYFDPHLPSALPDDR